MDFSWRHLVDHASALMCLTVIAHEADNENGLARVTYDGFQMATGKSRQTIARGLNILFEFELITFEERSRYSLADYDPDGGWAKFPSRHLYQRDTIGFFDDCSLRQRAELDALKLMFLFAAFRSQHTNVASLSYDTIFEYADIKRDRIKRATALLAAHGIAYPEVTVSEKSDFGVAYGYRLAGIDRYRHAGTTGRRALF
jgi:hypothetical protein